MVSKPSRLAVSLCPIWSASACTKGLSGAIADPVAGYVFRVDRANHKLMVFYGDYSNASDGVLVEATGVAIAEVEVELTLIGQ